MSLVFNTFHIEILILIFFIFLILYNVLFRSIDKQEYTTITQVLTYIVSVYKIKFFIPKYNELLNTYDLDDKSITNAKALFAEKYNELLSSACNDIVNSYLSKILLKKLHKYYTQHSLIIAILSLLESETEEG